jgi:hypothetical protein
MSSRLTNGPNLFMIRFMNAAPVLTEPETLAEQRAQDAQYYRSVLHRLIDIGSAMAETIHRQAQFQAANAAPDAPPSIVPSPQTREAFEQVARTIRRCVLLAQKVSEPVKIRVVDDSAERRAAARRLIIRRVEDSIHRDAPASERESLRAELCERLDAPEFPADLDRPVEEIIQEIRADLGLLGADGARRWKRRTPKDLAELSARAAAPARKRVGPFVLPMPPRGWVDPGERLGESYDGAPRFRGGP